MRGLTLVILAVSAVLAAVWWRNEFSLNANERHLFERLESVVADGPPSSSGIVRAFGLPPECLGKSCFFEQSEAENPAFAAGDLRPIGDGVVFVLERPKGDCVRVE